MESENSRKQLFIGILIGVLIMIVVTLITVLMVIRHYNKEDVGAGTFVSPDMSLLDDETVLKIEQIQDYLTKNSILDTDQETLREGLYQGILEGTGDKYCQYYSPEEIRELMSDYGGSFFGIGATLAMEGGEPVIQKTYKNSPAEKAGLLAGDIIHTVDGIDITGKTLDEVVSMIRGEKDTPVVIGVWRDTTDIIECTAIRDEIVVEVVEHEMKEDGIGYIHIEEWYDTTPSQFSEAYKDLQMQGMEKGLIVDLRSNTGGLLSSVLDVLRQLLPTGPMLYVEDNKGNRDVYSNDAESDGIDIPVVILTNGYTASASEIFTGAMKDYDKAISIGTKTYGKGVVQSFFYLADGSAIKFTTEQYFTPNGTAIDGAGIVPDIELALDAEAYLDEENPVDNQLERAIQYLEEGGFGEADIAA